jgi:hypothetical protein
MHIVNTSRVREHQDALARHRLEAQLSAECHRFV